MAMSKNKYEKFGNLSSLDIKSLVEESKKPVKVRDASTRKGKKALERASDLGIREQKEEEVEL